MIALLAFVLMAQEGEFLADTDSRCIKCHEVPRDDWKGSIHAERKVGCVDCHGKDKVDPKKKNAVHLKTADFAKIRGKTSEGDKRNESVPLCGKCHQEERTEFAKSLHHEEWEQGGKVQGCLSCHDFHKTTAANRRAILESKEMGCAKCHKPETKQIAAMKAYVGQTDALEGVLAKFEAHFQEKIPGISWTDELSSRDAHADALRQVRVRQHAARYTAFKALDKEIPAATAKVMPDVQKAEDKKRGFARFKVLALAGFLGVMALNLLLARAWCIRRFGGH